MPSTLQMAGPLTPADEAVIAGVRRSRFSIHLSTPRVRRWLLAKKRALGDATDPSGATRDGV